MEAMLTCQGKKSFPVDVYFLSRNTCIFVKIFMKYTLLYILFCSPLCTLLKIYIYLTTLGG